MLQNAALPYKHIIFDADDTLLRYRDDERAAFSRLFSSLGITADSDLLAYSNEMSEKIWTDVGLYDVHSSKIQQQYHILYRQHIELVFENIFAFCKKRDISFTRPLSPSAARDLFLQELEKGGNFVDGAKEILSYLKGRGYVISVATNGLSAIQIGRTAELKPLFSRLFISETLGAIKPNQEFFEKLLCALRAAPAECLFVGDSPFSDIYGAKEAGMHTAYFNPKNKPFPESFPPPDHTITNLYSLKDFL